MASDKPKTESKPISAEQSMELKKTWLGHRNTYAGLRFGFLFNGDMQTLKRKMVLPDVTLKNIRLRPCPTGVRRMQGGLNVCWQSGVAIGVAFQEFSLAPILPAHFFCTTQTYVLQSICGSPNIDAAHRFWHTRTIPPRYTNVHPLLDCFSSVYDTNSTSWPVKPRLERMAITSSNNRGGVASSCSASPFCISLHSRNWAREQRMCAIAVRTLCNITERTC